MKRPEPVERDSTTPENLDRGGTSSAPTGQDAAAVIAKIEDGLIEDRE